MRELKPQLIIPLNDSSNHFEILGKANAVKMRSGLVTLEPGHDVGSHSTKNFEELLIIIEGEGEIEAESAGRMKIAAGQFAYNPPNTQHNVYNTGSYPLRYIYVVSEAV